MSDTAAERLFKIISDPSNNTSGEQDEERPRLFSDVHIHLSEGWFSLFLLAAVVYSTVWCVQASGWVDHLGALSFTAAAGLIMGVIAAKQQRFSHLSTHVTIVVLGLLLTVWQTTAAYDDGNITNTFLALQRWFVVVTGGGTTNDDSIFFMLIVLLMYILAYISAWLLYHMRAPSLLIAANAVVLLINLNSSPNSFIIFLVLFLVSSLLLLLRFNLYESIQRWQKQGLRYPDDLGWDVMQAGALFSIAILIFSWLLPGNYKDPLLSQIWEAKNSPLVMLQGNWDRALSFSGGENPANHGNFQSTLVLGGNPNLTQEVVFRVKMDQHQSQYLAFISYDTYSGRGWSIVHVDPDMYHVKANDAVSTSAFLTHDVKQTIEIITPPGEDKPYLVGASEITALSQNANILSGSGGVISWIGEKSLIAGTSYTATSAVSSADEDTLRSVPTPANAPKFNPNANPDAERPVNAYDDQLVANFTQLPSHMDPRIKTLAKKIVRDAGAKSMYDQVTAIETYLRENYKYNVDITPRSGEDPAAWFLFDNPHKDGFCNYFSSAMVLLARSLNIPARIVAGYTNGKYENGQWVIRGQDAHSWVQVNFAGYGWVNFEPSTSFRTFDRPLPHQYSSNSSSNTSNSSGNLSIPGIKGHNRLHDSQLNGSDNGSSSNQSQLSLRQGLSITLGSVILLLLFAAIWFGIWWRNLFRHAGVAAQIYGRVSVLANWAGIKYQSSQTPYEYLHTLSDSALPTPKDADVLERLGDIFVRERWADPHSQEHPYRSGEMNELPGIWRQLRYRLLLYVAWHPDFLREIPRYLNQVSMRVRNKYRERKKIREEI